MRQNIKDYPEHLRKIVQAAWDRGEVVPEGVKHLPDPKTIKLTEKQLKWGKEVAKRLTNASIAQPG